MSDDVEWFVELYEKVKGRKMTSAQRKRLMKEKEKKDRLFELFRDTCQNFDVQVGDWKSLLVWDFLSALIDGELQKAYGLREHLKLLTQ